MPVGSCSMPWDQRGAGTGPTDLEIGSTYGDERLRQGASPTVFRGTGGSGQELCEQIRHATQSESPGAELIQTTGYWDVLDKQLAKGIRKGL
eukprot:3194934-Pyramimonas_sp.AAC.1